MKATSKKVGMAETQKSKSTLAIIQITRFGDLIQTAQAVLELRKSNPEYRVILVARSQFSKPLDFLLKKIFDKIYHLDTKKIFNNSEISGLQNSLIELNQFLDDVSTESIDVLINLSFSKSSSYLSSLIKAQHKLGTNFDLNNRMQISDKWSQVIFSTVMRGTLNPYSMVNLFKNVIGIKFSNSSPVIQPLTVRTNTIIIHPFASQERKAWKSEKWVEVIYRTLKDNENHSILIVGAKNEILRSQLIIENPLLKTFSHRINNLTGKTTLAELAEHLKQAKLFVGHDSMVGHMAAFYHTTSLTVSLGSVRPYETTPYQVSAYNVAPRTKCFPCFPSDACNYTQCHNDIPYQVISSSIKQLLTKQELTSEWINENISSFHMSSVNIYRSNIKHGQMELAKISDSNADGSDIFRSLYRIAWSFLLNNSEENLPFPKLTSVSHRELLEAMTGLQHLYELSEFGKKYSRYILEEVSSQTPSLVKIKDYSKKIDEIDQLKSLVVKTSPCLAPVVDYSSVRKANLFGEGVVQLTESSYYAFEEFSSLCRILFELIENIISEHKISSSKLALRSDIIK